MAFECIRAHSRVGVCSSLFLSRSLSLSLLFLSLPVIYSVSWYILQKEKRTVVAKNKDGQPMSLEDVFKSEGITSQELNLDKLGELAIYKACAFPALRSVFVMTPWGKVGLLHGIPTFGTAAGLAR